MKYVFAYTSNHGTAILGRDGHPMCISSEDAKIWKAISRSAGVDALVLEMRIPWPGHIVCRNGGETESWKVCALDEESDILTLFNRESSEIVTLHQDEFRLKAIPLMVEGVPTWDISGYNMAKCELCDNRILSADSTSRLKCLPCTCKGELCLT